MMVGLVWNWVFPINKSIWTSSYVVFTAGMACVSLATIMWIVDVNGLKRWTKPFVIYGMNPMVAFVGSAVIERLIYSVIYVTYQGNRFRSSRRCTRSGSRPGCRRSMRPWRSPSRSC